MQAQEFIFEDDEDYRIPHRAPMHDSGSPLYDVTGTYPDDIYGPNGVQYYGTREPWDARSIHVIKLCKGKPNQTVQIFRAVPKEVKSNTINPGDWVTVSREYATQHGKGLGKYKLLTKIVPAKTLFTNGDSIHEWGYDPGGAAQPVAEDNASPTKISFKVKKGRGRFATEMIVNGQQAGVYQYDANTGRSIAEVFPEFRSQGLGKILVLHAIYTAAKLGLDFQEDESRTAAYDNVLDSLSSNGYIVDDDGYWYVTGEGEQYLQQSLKNKAPPVAENFADGKGPGRPGDSVRHGIPKNATMAELEKASRSAGRKGQLARWQLNMRRGKAELSEIKQRLDAKCWPGTRKEGTKIKGGVRVNNCVPVSETGVKKPQLKTYAARVKLKQLGYTNIVDATVMARNPEMARRLLHQLYGGNSSVVGQPREIK
jgi:GNAT superfamily N-acetyltransferase